MSRLLFNPKTNRLLATSTGLRHSHSDTCTCCFCKGFDCTPIADCPAATPGSWKVEASGITLGGTFEGSGGGYGNVPLPDHTIAFSGDTTFAGEGSALQFGAAGFNACAWAGIIPTPIKLAITAAMALDANQDPLTYTTSWTVEPSVSVNFAARQNEEDEWVGVMEVSFRITKYAEGHDLNPSGPDESTYLVANLLVFRGEFTPSCDTQEIVVANELTAGEWSSTQFSIRERQYTYHIGSGGTIKLTPCRASGQCGEGACCERYDAYFSNVTRRRVATRLEPGARGRRRAGGEPFRLRLSGPLL
jgi:hypothetical protein